MIVTVDTGGTKTLVAIFSPDGTITAREKFPTPQATDEYLETLGRTIDALTKHDKIDVISVGLPANIINNVAVWFGNLPWVDFNIVEVLTHRYNVPVYLENDANLAGLAETRALGKIPVSSLYVTISTGIGTGIITNGSIDPGTRRSEGGHMPIEYDGVVQAWEDFASGRAIKLAYGLQASEITDEKTWYHIADRISRGFLAIIPMIQPDIVIVGGGVGTHFEKFREPLVGLLQERLLDSVPCPPFVKAQHPEEAVVYGCYYHALDQAAA